VPHSAGDLITFSQTSWVTVNNAAATLQDSVSEFLKSAQVSRLSGFHSVQEDPSENAS
jgi:hypothetical protein